MGIMEPEHLLAIAPSVVAIVVAVISLITTLIQGSRSERQLKEQNKAADDRAAAQRAADEKHWRAELLDEADKRGWESEQQRFNRNRDVTETLHQARRTQLHHDAAEFFATAGEATDALERVSRSFQHWANADSWGMLANALEPWSGQDVQRRLAVATATLSLYGLEVRTGALKVQSQILAEYQDCRDRYAARSSQQLWLTGINEASEELAGLLARELWTPLTDDASVVP